MPILSAGRSNPLLLQVLQSFGVAQEGVVDARRIVRLTRLSKDYRLGFQKFLQSVNAAFPTDTGLFEAAEWRQRVMVQRVDKHPSSLQPLRHAAGPLRVG